MSDDTPKKTRSPKGLRKTASPKLPMVPPAHGEARLDSQPPPWPAESRNDEPTVAAMPGARRSSRPQEEHETGDETYMTRDLVCEAVYLEAMERGLSEDEAYGSAEDVADRLRLQGSCEPMDTRGMPPTGFYDLRGEQDYKYPGGKRKVLIRGNSVVMRDPAEVHTIVVHQTAAEFGVSKRAIAKADGDIELARARRALDVACHVMAFRAGYFVAAHDLTVYVNHANRFNSHSLGLEIEGRYPGLMDDPSTVAREDLKTTWGGNPTILTDQTVDAACRAIEWLVNEGRDQGMPIEFIASHRQSSDTRRSDPGEEIWRRVVLDFAVAEMGLTAMRDSPWREGRPIPTEWDSDGTGEY